VSIEEINALIRWASANREHLTGRGEKLVMAREYRARQITGQPATYRGDGPGPHGGPIICTEH